MYNQWMYQPGHSLDLRTVLLSISGLYPFITMILGILMSRQHTNWENEKAKDRFIESEQRNEIYTNGTIEIGSKDKGNEIVFFVKDTGIGIPENRLEAVFDRFVQADLTLSRSHKGFGLGLSIAKAYAQMLGGDLWVESEEGKGSTFFFNIPKDEIVADKAETNTPEDKEKRLKQYSKILVAKDDEMNYLFLKNLLEHKGFGIVHAWNGEEAVEMLRNDDDISLVLMDIKMPVMSGEEATRQIRTFNQDIPIIAQTAYAMPSDRSKLLEIGCNDYISKPIVTDSLVKLLQKHVNPSG